MQIQTDQCFWPMTPGYSDHPELVFLFERHGGMPLYLASNYPYELWVDGTFITIYEKTSPDSSLAHSWSVAIASLYSTIEVDAGLQTQSVQRGARAS